MTTDEQTHRAIQEHAARIVAGWEPLTDQQLNLLAAILSPRIDQQVAA